MSTRQAITLLECLIAIAAIALLIQLLLPTIQAAREASRQNTCQNNLQQIGLACARHVEATGRFPSGGWGLLWAGDPDRGNDSTQPGGWIFSLLPFMEHESLHAQGVGQMAEQKLMSIKSVCQTPLNELICPSRRPLAIYPCDDAPILRNADWHRFGAKSDYAANAGEHYLEKFEGPVSLAEGDAMEYAWPDTSEMSGIVYLRSEVRPAGVVDGLSNTYFVGEKYIDASCYFDSEDVGDARPMYIGFDNDTIRWSTTPKRDKAGTARPLSFGSAHTDRCHFLYCDGSVRAVGFEIDAAVARTQGNRNDGVP